LFKKQNGGGKGI